MDFAITKKQQELQERAREAITRAVEPLARQVPDGGKLGAEEMRTLYRGLAPLGYLGSTIPESEGGAGLAYVDYGLLLEALAHGPIVLGEIVPPRTIAYLGTREQKARWLPRLLAGDWSSTAAITEPQAGSDVRGLQAAAVLEGDHFRLTGRKKWIKLGGVADLITCLVVSDPARGAKGGTSRLVLERAVSPWRSTELPSVGIRNLSYAELDLDGVRVPRENLIGETGAGTDAFNRGIEASRPLVGMQAVGLAAHALDTAIAYARTRVAFGRPLARFQAIQTALADAAAELDAARFLCLRALWMLDQGKRCPREASMGKVFATEAAVRICHVAMDTMGAFGLAEDAGVERCWRDARMLTVIDGASGIQRLIVGRELCGAPAFV
ncbi:MAG: acyl-CoA dehydrogenase family protein [Candidatus Rokubacteria bacterium]|nr:acyl-CoA dehydrogenase family protein [Candidatus Rokubacteria bacterium]